MSSQHLKSALVIALDHSISYNENARLDRWYEDLCSFLRLTCKVYGAVINNTALMFLDDDQYEFHAIIVTDPAIMSRRNKYPVLSDKLVAYVEAGGTLIFSPYCRLAFGSSVQATDVNNYMERVWSLPWKLGTADTRNFKPNFEINIAGKERWIGALTARNIYAVQLDGVRTEDKLYVDPDENGSPALSTPYGRGRLCWLGDVLLNKATVWMMIILGGLHPEKPPSYCQLASAPGSSAAGSIPPSPLATSPSSSTTGLDPSPIASSPSSYGINLP